MVEQNESITHLYRIGHTEIEITAPLSMKSPRNLEKFRIGQAKRPDDEVIHYQVEMTEGTAGRWRYPKTVAVPDLWYGAKRGE